MVYSYSKLKGRIVEKFGSQSAFANELGVSENSVSKKLNCKTEFSQSDIVKWSELLCIKIVDYSDYFFA
jgi:DNA-binding transcriptional regulator YdaS (Cro superfamily)